MLNLSKLVSKVYDYNMVDKSTKAVKVEKHRINGYIVTFDGRTAVGSVYVPTSDVENYFARKCVYERTVNSTRHWILQGE